VEPYSKKLYILDLNVVVEMNIKECAEGAAKTLMTKKVSPGSTKHLKS